MTSELRVKAPQMPPACGAAETERISDEYPRPDSNRRYRLERGMEGSSENVEDQ